MQRCPWAKSELMIAYHDREWGVPVHDDRVLFEFLILEAAQAGLSWETILKKRDNYRKALDGFDPAVAISEDDVATKASVLLGALKFPAILWEGRPIPTVHILKIFKDAEGRMVSARSVGAAVVGERSVADR